jgi:hypothetical protein
LKELETTIEELPEKKTDSIRSFNEYNQGNEDYYSSATRHIMEIRDSVLREKIKALISSSESDYKNKIVRHNALLNTIDTKALSLEDLHRVLKLTKTLPVIEHYQDDHIPGIARMQDIIRQYERAIQKTDSLIKK